MATGLEDVDYDWTLDPSTLPDVNMPEDEGFGWDSIWNFIGSDAAKSLLSLGSGIYGLYESSKMKDLARQAYGASDPFGPERAGYAKQLAALMKDPGSITSDPGYEFQRDQGELAVVRQMAAKGYLGSGNMGTALVQYGQDYAKNYLDEKTKLLASLAGANIAPNFGGALSGYASGIDTASKALASIGYGATIARPNAAGGEAAKIGGDISTIGGSLKKLGGLSGNQTLSTTGSYASSAGSIVSGVGKGGVQGYGQALAGAAKLASTAGYGGTATSAAGAAGNIASGNYVGAAKDLYSLYSGTGSAAGTAAGASGTNAAAGAGAAASSGASLTGAAAAASSVASAAGVAIAMIELGKLAVSVWGGGRSQSRNLASFEAALGDQLEKKQYMYGRTPVNMYKIPGKDFWITMPQFKELAGNWYGATFAPDGDREGWTEKLANTWNNLKPVDLSNLGIKP